LICVKPRRGLCNPIIAMREKTAENADIRALQLALGAYVVVFAAKLDERYMFGYKDRKFLRVRAAKSEWFRHISVR
jgi:hypothetical protein